MIHVRHVVVAVFVLPWAGLLTTRPSTTAALLASKQVEPATVQISMGHLSLKVVPGSSRDEIVGWLGDSLKVKVKAPPEKGGGNEAVVALLADRLGIDPASVAVVSGHGSPAKVVSVDGIDDDAIDKALPPRK